MKTLRTAITHCLLLPIVIMNGIVLRPAQAAAQTGDKAVYGAGGNLAASSAWVDASAFCTSTNNHGTNSCANVADFCEVVNTALTNLVNSLSPAGGVVDARGVLPISGTSPEPCDSNPFPSTLGNIPITVLLPAYSIELNSYGTSNGAWIMPDNVKLVGTGLQTVLVSGTIFAPYMIEMGQPPSGSCSVTYNGIGIEHLQLNTQTGGIDNQCAGLGSYVNDVKIAGAPPMAPTAPLGGTALNIGSGAGNSGPYSDVYVVTIPYGSCGDNGSATAVSCVVVGAQTRGIHGLTCVGSDASGQSPNGPTPSGYAGVVVNAGNNSIEDVHLESFYDGIQIGATTNQVGNVFVSNVEAGNTGSCNYGGVANTVHVCGPNVPPNAPQLNNYACSTQGGYESVTDLAMVGISNGPFASHPFGSVQDDQVGTLIEGCNGNLCMDPITSGIYILGRPAGTPGSTSPYPRFATNPANSNVFGNGSTLVPTWGVGGAAPNGQCQVPGALYSDTGSSGGNPSIYVCTVSGAWLSL